jgi:hypothetical protein
LEYILGVFINLLEENVFQNPQFFRKTLRLFPEQSTLVMESSLARLGSGSSRHFLLLLEKLKPKKSAGLIWPN